MLYVADHAIANEFVLGVPWSSPFGLGFIVTSTLCGVCQSLRADKDYLSKKLWARYIGKRMKFASFAYAVEMLFMLTEHGLFLVFLFGMTSGVRIVDAR